MSLNRVFKALIELGLSQNDARVYIHLATKGSKSAKQICDALNIKKQIIYPSLKNLRNNRIIAVSSRRPLTFSALPFDEVLDMLLKKKFEQSEEILETKKELVKSWKSVDWNNNK